MADRVTRLPADPTNAAQLVDLLRRLVSRFDPFDYEQGLCHWCGGGWEYVTGPRGGKPSFPTKTNAHYTDCPFAEALATLGTPVVIIQRVDP